MTWQRWKLTWHLSPKLVRHSPQRLLAVLTSFNSPLLYQHPLPLSAVCVSITAHLKLISCIGGSLLSTAACKICKPDNNKSMFCFKKLFLGQVLVGHVNVIVECECGM